MYRLAFARLAVVVLVLASFSPTAAQSQSPYPPLEGSSAALLDLLRVVPDVPAREELSATQFFTYGDYRAAEQGRPAVFAPQNFAQLRDQDDGVPWAMAAPLGGIQLSYLFSGGGDMPDVMGFDFFSVDRSLEWGLPPEQGILLQGDFDAASIDAALTSNGFARDSFDDLPLWCGEEVGCDGGTRIDPRDRQVANLFGGDLGRRWPTILMDDVLFASASFRHTALMVGAGAGIAPSLADNAAMYTALEAANLPNTLLRAAWAFDSGVAAMEPIGPLEAEITPYPVVLFADLVDAEAQYAVVALSFEDAALAESAVEVVVSRLETADSMRVRQRWADLIAERGAALQTPQVFTSETTGYAAAVFTFRYPLPSDEPGDDGRYPMSGQMYNLLLQAAFARDLVWLAVVP